VFSLAFFFFFCPLQELANKRKVYSNVKEEEEEDSNVTLDEMKQAFRANVRLLLLLPCELMNLTSTTTISSQLAMVENISGEESTEEIVEPEVTRDDKYIKPPGFVSATDMLKFSEEKMQSDLDKLMKKAKKCVFCRPSAQRPVLDPMNVSLLTMFLTPTGDIIGRRHNGNCRRHQRKLATTIKRAKHMGIFSYKYGGFTIYSPFHEPPETYAEDDGEGDEEQYGESDEEGDYSDYDDDEDEGQQNLH
jgi:small subunit ribosomal protein S18